MSEENTRKCQAVLETCRLKGKCKYLYTLFLISAMGCTTETLSKYQVERTSAITSLSSLPKISESSLATQSRFAFLAEYLDQEAIKRSSILHEVRAAKAYLAAKKFDRYPKIRPTASVPLDSSRTATFGLYIDQIVWDGGLITAELTSAELEIAEAYVQAWRSRNEFIYKGLKAFVEMSRLHNRINIYQDQKIDLMKISDSLEVRASGGVSDRGELLRVNAALQENQRNILKDMSDFRQERIVLLNLLPSGMSVTPLENLAPSTMQCHRSWSEVETPDDILARFQIQKSTISEDMVRAQRFPKIILGVGSEFSSQGWTDPTIGLRLDASDILGFGQNRDIEAAKANTQAKIASYQLQKDETRDTFIRLESDYEGYLSDMHLLEKLQSQAIETLKLYEEQLKVGSISIIDGITLYKELSDTKVAIIDLQANILMNCLENSMVRGLLASLGENNGL